MEDNREEQELKSGNGEEGKALGVIKDVDLKSTMESSYIDYSMSVIVSRALPDVKDGLKPVQRRILYAAMKMGATADSKTKKCATIVGETMGHYHPHGDSSIYGALVYMGQPWSLRYPLIEKQGSFGSEDGDGPAAARYTEGKLSKIAMEMLDGINKETVDFVPNFANEDGYQEPVLLPARIPNILINGTTGIAVGMATNIPPHNLRETIDAAVLMLDNRINEDRDTDIEELLSIIKGPDFPTGAEIIGHYGIRQSYLTGRGKIRMRAVSEFEQMKNGKTAIIIKELPYLVYRSKVISDIAELVRDKKIDGITDIKDLFGKNSKDKIRIELRKDVNPQIVLNQLYKHTQLQDTFGVIMLCIVDGEPKVLNLKEILREYLKHQETVVRRRTEFNLKKAEARAHILEGYLKAVDNIDEVISIIRASADTETAKVNLIGRFGFSEAQAQAIVDMRLKALTGLERKKIEEEYQKLQITIADLRAILADRKKILGVIKEDITAIREKFGDDRKTVIRAAEEDDEIEDEDLIQDGDTIVAMTKLGYIKRMSLDNFHAQNRGGRGIKGMQVLDEDYTTTLRMTRVKDLVMFFTNQGRVYVLKAYQIPESGRASRGTPVINLISLQPSEKVTAVITKHELEPERYILMATKNGTIKKTPAAEYANVRRNGLLAITLREGDELVSVKDTEGTEDVLLSAKSGTTICFNEKTVRVCGRTSIGVRGMNLLPGDELVGMEVSDPEKTVLFISENGIGKRTTFDSFSRQGRGGKGARGYRVTEKTGALIGTCSVSDDEEIMIITTEGIIIRTSVAGISILGKSASGVKLINLDKDSDARVASFTIVKKSEEESEENNGKPQDAAEEIKEEGNEEK